MAFKVFVEDAGTGLTNQADADFLDAASIAAANHDANATDYAVAAPSLAADYTVPEVTLGAAQYRLGVSDLTTRDHGDGTTTWPRATLVVQADQTTVALTDGATNDVFVTVDLSNGPDSAAYDVRADGSTPSLPSLLVATVDTSADTATVQNDNPDIDAASVSADVLEAGGADTRFDFVNDVIGGTVATGDAGPVWITTLADQETLLVTQAALTLDGGGAAPTGLDLIIGDLTNMTSETTLIDGDGTVKDDQTGTPLGSYQNTSGGPEQVAVLIDNGQFNAGSGSNQDAIGSFIGRVA